MSGVAGARWPGELRPYQCDILRRLEDRWSALQHRAWVVLPPGAGKTLVGLEAARRLGHRVVVLAPNTAIQGQWVAHWNTFERPAGCAAGTRRDLGDAVSVLTYQSLAVFDPDAETDEDGHGRSLLGRLHPNGAALVDALRTAGPLTIVLDECHHLMQVWGRLLAEVLDGVEGAHVIGLTGTPAGSLSEAEAGLVDTLFGEPIIGPSIPALVRDGYLAPYAELAWVTRPTAEECDYIAGQGERFAEFCTDLLAPGFARTDFLTWLHRRFCDRDTDGVGPISWGWVATREPALADAVLRLHHAGLAPLPPGARLLERHRLPPRAEDWMALLGDYVTTSLGADPEDPRDSRARERIRQALPSIGYRLTRRGIRAGRSPVDRALARSAAKSRGTVEILATEAAALNGNLRALVLCDHEHATARPPEGLRGVLTDDSGSAWLQLETLVADERTRKLAPMLVTGKTVAAAPDTAAAFVDWARRHHPDVELWPESAGGLARIEGTWSSRTSVRLVTEFLDSGACRALVGTRGLLGEGWDARGVNTVVDLTTATTPTAVVQTRGRALRLSPHWPRKTAHTWTVVCVSDAHPKGAADWTRFARKHEGYLGVDAEGEVTSGVAHLDASFSPYEPPPSGELDAVNARMLVRAEDRSATRARWRIGAPYNDEILSTLRVRPARGAARDASGPDGRNGPPPAVPASRGIRTAERLSLRPTVRSVPLGVLVALVVVLGTGTVGASGALLPAGILAGALTERALVHLPTLRAARRLVPAAVGTPGIGRLGYAVADALRAAGHVPVGAEGVSATVDGDGVYRLALTGCGHEAAAVFRTALDEMLAPVTGRPRYLIPRSELPPLGDQRDLRRYAAACRRPRPPVNDLHYHAVPAVLGRNRKGAQALARAWRRWVSDGAPVYTRSMDGEALLHAWHGTDPYPVRTSTRLTWS